MDETAIIDFFRDPLTPTHRQYLALRMFFLDNKCAEEVAETFGYSMATIYTLTRNFRAKFKQLGRLDIDDHFFVSHPAGPKEKELTSKNRGSIIELRKKYLSVQDIKSVMDARGVKISEKHIFDLIRKEGFARLPRRSRAVKQEAILAAKTLTAQKSELLESKKDDFYSQDNTGILCLLPYIKQYGIGKIIEDSKYPSSKTLPRLNSILSFLALKICNFRRYSADDLWCMDRGLGLFAGLNVLPKAAWFSSYSHRVTREMNIGFLRSLHKLWIKVGLLSDTANIDFVAVPYWGDGDHLENNWSGTRHHALPSILAAIAQDPDTGIITYGDCNVRHNNEAEVAVEFLDFYKKGGDHELKYLVFDSKFTTYENLSKLDDNNVKFITIRRRSKNLVDRLNDIPANEWKKIRVPMANGRTRQIKVHDEVVLLKGYGKKIRQVSITGHGKIKPALIISNDFNISREQIIHKYARRWLVEQTISEQTHFFHLNKISSSMVIKVDFDLTMTILAYNLYKLFALNLDGYSHCTAATLYRKFLHNGGVVNIGAQDITINLKKKRNLPAILTAMDYHKNCKISWLHNKKLKIVGATYS